MTDDDATVDQLAEASMRMYLLLYSGGGMPETQEETNAMTVAWGAWLAGIGDALVDGNPFTAKLEESFPRRSGLGWSHRPDGVGILADRGDVHG